MLPQQRHRAILDILIKQGAARTPELAEHFAVTVETIRRDLEQLTKEGKLVRTHGGAIAANHPTRDRSHQERKVLQLEEKESIARVAVELVQPRDIIYIDASSTALQMARLLPDLEVTVITSSLDVIEELGTRSDVNLIGTGGVYVDRSRSFVGPAAIATIHRYHINKAFISANGVHYARGLSESNEVQSQLKAEAMRLADEVVLLADSSKIGHRGAYFYAQMTDVSLWITDDQASLQDLAPYHELVPEIRQASLGDANKIKFVNRKVG